MDQMDIRSLQFFGRLMTLAVDDEGIEKNRKQDQRLQGQIDDLIAVAAGDVGRVD